MSSTRFAFTVLSLWAAFGLAPTADAQELTPKHYDSMRWRMIGPFRGGRTVGAVGVPGQPNVFYVGVTNGGVWKTNDYGRTWKPIFDDQPTGSVGSVAVAESNPDILYVGSGEGLHRPDLSVGDGVYKSTDGGKTWKHIGTARWSADSRPSRSIRRIPIAFSWPSSDTPTAPMLSAVFPLDRRRQDVGKGPLQGREHRCRRLGD